MRSVGLLGLLVITLLPLSSSRADIGVPCECTGIGQDRLRSLLVHLQDADVLPPHMRVGLSDQCAQTVQRMMLASGDNVQFIVSSERVTMAYVEFTPGNPASCGRFGLLVQAQGKDPDLLRYNALLSDCLTNRNCAPLHDYTLTVINPNINRKNYLETWKLVCDPTPEQKARKRVHIDVYRTSAAVKTDRDPLSVSLMGQGSLNKGPTRREISAGFAAKIEKYWDRKPISHDVRGSAGISVSSYADPNVPSTSLTEDLGAILWSDAAYTAWFTNHFGVNGRLTGAHLGPIDRDVGIGSAGPHVSLLGRSTEKEKGHAIVLSTETRVEVENNSGKSEPAYYKQNKAGGTPSIGGQGFWIPSTTAFVGWERGLRAGLTQEVALRAKYSFGPQEARSWVESTPYVIFNLTGDKSKGTLGDFTAGYIATWHQALSRKFSLGVDLDLSHDKTPRNANAYGTVYGGASLIFTPTN